MTNPMLNTEPLKWKKEEEWSDSYPSETYVNTKGNRVRVWKTGLSLKEMRRRGHKGTYIAMTSNSKEYFKTKSEAKTYAKQWMRLH